MRYSKRNACSHVAGVGPNFQPHGNLYPTHGNQLVSMRSSMGHRSRVPISKQEFSFAFMVYSGWLDSSVDLSSGADINLLTPQSLLGINILTNLVLKHLFPALIAIQHTIMLEVSWKNLSRETAGKQKSRKEAQRTSEPSNHSSQGLMPSRSKSPKQRRPSIFPKLSSFKRGSVDSSRHIKGQEHSHEASQSSSDVACSHDNVESSTEGYNDRESTYTSGYDPSRASECLCSKILAVYRVERLKLSLR